MMRIYSQKPYRSPPRISDRKAESPTPARGFRRSASFIQRLQRTMGNRCVLRLVNARAKSIEEEPGTITARTQVANGEPTRLAPGPALQRSARSGNKTAPVDGAALRQTLYSPGRAVEGGVRVSMAARLGQDFGRVRLHTDGPAARTASMLNARAYTVGRHVVFGSGEYRPGTREGDRLLAHELVHAWQQRFARPRGLTERLPVDDEAGDAETQARRVSEGAVGREPVESVSGGARRATAAGTLVQRQNGEDEEFTLEGSDVGNLIVSELGKITVAGSNPATPRVDSQEVLAILKTSRLFLDVANTVNNDLKRETQPQLTLRFHEREDIGTHFKHAEKLMEVYVPRAQPLLTVITGIVHEMVHASRGAPAPSGSTSKYGSITRQERGGIADESATRERENEIMKEIQDSTAWKAHTGDAEIPAKATAEKEVRSLFVSGKPQLTYQEKFILEEAKTTLESALDAEIVAHAEDTAKAMVETGMVGWVTMSNVESFQYTEKVITRHKENKSLMGPTTADFRERALKLSDFFLDYYDLLERSERSEKKRSEKIQKGLRYLGILLAEKQISNEWEGESLADDERRNEHLNVLKELLGSKLKGITL